MGRRWFTGFGIDCELIDAFVSALASMKEG